MGTVTFVLGLAGSGKSWYIRNSMKVDKAFEEGFAASDQHEGNHADLISRLRRGESCAVSELQYLQPGLRQAYVDRLRQELDNQVEVKFVCFENDLAAANHNCRTRTDKAGDAGGAEHVAINERCSPHYRIPEGAIVLKIHRL